MVLQIKATLVRRVVIAFLVASVLTFYGLLNFWQGIEAPSTWNHVVPVVLLFPILVLSTLFRKLSSDGHLSALTYRVVLVLGPIAQFLFYYGVIAVIRWIIVRITKAFRASRSRE